MLKIVLASASARRHELLKRLVEDFETTVSNFDEDKVLFNGDFEAYVKELSKGKALAVLENVKEPSIIIGCDTIVAFKDEVLGKPKNKAEAYSMLKSLSGNTHKVFSGITLISTKEQRIISEAIVTEVKFSSLTDEDINKYIETGEPMDKAGAYGIQGYGGVFVEEIHGCYYNVVGLPINKLKSMLNSL